VPPLAPTTAESEVPGPHFEPLGMSKPLSSEGLAVILRPRLVIRQVAAPLAVEAVAVIGPLPSRLVRGRTAQHVDK
jgi:hypothetical protein